MGSWISKVPSIEYNIIFGCKRKSNLILFLQLLILVQVAQNNKAYEMLNDNILMQ
jgi:hypothetical protein